MLFPWIEFGTVAMNKLCLSRPCREGWLDVERAALVEFTSEDKNYPIEAAFVSGEARGWRAECSPFIAKWLCEPTCHPGPDITTTLRRASYIEYRDHGRVAPKARKENIVANPFVHVELNTPDPRKATEFYSKLFQWQLEDMSNPAVPDGTYTVIKVGEGTGGGLMQQIPGGPAGWLAYVGVDDIHAATKKAESLGAEVMKDVTEVTGMGWLSFIRDPTGAVLGLWQSKSK